jgi:hypothetical protein
MRGAIPPLPQYSFIAWCPVKINVTRTILPLTFYLRPIDPDPKYSDDHIRS